MDRNFVPFGVIRPAIESLSARRAWIEIVHEVFANFEGFVALRKESVDRNLIFPNSIRRCLSRSPQGERG